MAEDPSPRSRWSEWSPYEDAGFAQDPGYGDAGYAEDRHAADRHAADRHAEDRYADDRYAADRYAADARYADAGYADAGYAEGGYAEAGYDDGYRAEAGYAPDGGYTGEDAYRTVVDYGRGGGRAAPTERGDAGYAEDGYGGGFGQYAGGLREYDVDAPRTRALRSADERGPDPGEERARAGRTLFVILFWFTLAASVELWWLDTPMQSIASTGDVMLAIGRITGMVGGFILLAQVLLMSRVGWLERWMGSHDLLIWHRDLGGFVVVAILAHVVTIILGYAAQGHVSWYHETWTMFTTFEDMVSAFIATGILVGIGVLAIRAIRRRLPYEIWYFLHVTSYLVLLLAYGHQFSLGQELSNAGFGQRYWIALYLFVIACLVWGRVVAPLRLNLRHQLRVMEVVPEGSDMVSIYIGGRGLSDLQARAGQYFRWRFLTRGCWWQAHPFSLSAAPNPQWLRLTVKIVGDHTSDLRRLHPGVRVFAEGPSGVFTAERSVKPRALLIAGGSGIAPIRALLEELPRGTAVIYRASTEDDLVFREELEWLARERESRIWYVLGARDEPWPRRVFTPRGLKELVPDVRRRDVFLCGPSGIVQASLKALRRLRVPRRQIHLDPFEF